MTNVHRPKILIIDDDAAVRQSFADHLEDQDYRIVTAEDGRAGLNVFERESADLVLVDLRMPRVDGLEVLARIKETSPDTPLIVVSGTGVIADAVEALRRGAWDYMLKPVEDLTVLTHAIENALEKSRLVQENRRYQEHLEQMVAERTSALEKATERLQRSEQQFRSILDNIQSGIVIVEVDSRRIVYVNPAVSEMVGAPSDEIVGERCSDSLFPTREGKCPVLDLCLEVKSSEQQLNTRDGRRIPILKTISRMVYRGKDCLLESFFDLSAQKMAEKEKTGLEKQLIQAQKMEALGTLAGGIAHDFNNILSALMGFTELCLLDLDDPADPIHQRLKSMLHAEDRAKDLASQILAFSRMQEHILTPVHIAPIVKEALKLLKASLPANIELNPHIISGEQVMADPTQIHQVIMNLCTNAYHAMEENGGLLTVSLTPFQCDASWTLSHGDLPPGSYLRLTVEDTGSGIPPAILDKIFDPYFSTKGKDKGTGLGLSVVHGIVKTHGGAIMVDSQMGKGTAVKVFLPVTDDDERVQTQGKTILPRGTERILLVDDEKDLVEIGSQMLERLGYNVTGVVGAVAALETFKREPLAFDLVITDWSMPVMNGDRLAQEINRIRPELPIVLCTGFSEPFDQKRADNLGIRRLIMKPLAMNILADSIRQVLDET